MKTLFLCQHVAVIVDSSQQGTLRVRTLWQLTRQSYRAGDVETSRRLVVQALVRALVMEHFAKVIEAALLREEKQQVVSSCLPSACDSSACGGHFVAVGRLEFAHVRSQVHPSERQLRQTERKALTGDQVAL